MTDKELLEKIKELAKDEAAATQLHELVIDLLNQTHENAITSGFESGFMHCRALEGK